MEERRNFSRTGVEKFKNFMEYRVKLKFVIRLLWFTTHYRAGTIGSITVFNGTTDCDIISLRQHFINFEKLQFTLFHACYKPEPKSCQIYENCLKVNFLSFLVFICIQLQYPSFSKKTHFLLLTCMHINILSSMQIKISKYLHSMNTDNIVINNRIQ